MSALKQAHAARLAEKGLRIATLRNGGVGFLIGSVLLAIRFHKAIKSEKSWNRFKSEWIQYLMKFPLFLATFTLLYKLLIKIGRRICPIAGIHRKTGQRLLGRKVAISISSFFCGYIAQMTSPVFSWSWALYALLRSMLGMTRLLIPSDLIPNPADFYFIIHGILPYLITYNISHVSLSYYNFFRECLDVKPLRYHYMYEHNHGILPDCKYITHVFDRQSCLQTHIKDGIYRFKMLLQFYVKFYLLTSMFGGIRSLFRHPLGRIYKLLSQTVRSSLFMLFAFHFPSRIHCLYRYLLTAYHRRWRKDAFTVVACNQMMIMLVVSAVFGTASLRFEVSQNKRSDIALFSIWRLVEVYIRKLRKLQTYDKDYDDPILGNRNVPAVLFGTAWALCVYVHLTDSKKLKALERSVVTFLLA
eukprot:68188_1